MHNTNVKVHSDIARTKILKYFIQFENSALAEERILRRLNKFCKYTSNLYGSIFAAC